MQRNARTAMTLVEMLVAMAVTLIMMGAVVTLFGNVGSSISDSRAVMEISERLRNARNVLQQDLHNVTVTMLPPRNPSNDEGYFEYIEGRDSDWNHLSASPASPGYGLQGDSDDLLFFTARSRKDPYVGVIQGATAQAPTAEIVYYTYIAPNTPTIVDPQSGGSFQLKTLYRRVLLISPQHTVGSGSENDLSVRVSGTGNTPNTLGDTTKRENRFAHNPAMFPFQTITPGTAPMVPLTTRPGSDILLTNVLSFDVKVYDRLVPVGTTTTGVAVLPSDPGYTAPSPPYPTGGFVDLNFTSYLGSSSIVSQFSHGGSPQYLAQNAAMKLPLATYDTWSQHYNSPIGNLGGVNFTGTGTDGLDNDGNGVVDDLGEQQAPPPYSVPLRGIQVKLRVYEPDSRQVREVTVVQDFLPQ